MIVRTDSIQQLDVGLSTSVVPTPAGWHAIGDAVYETARLYSWDRFRMSLARLTDACLHGHGGRECLMCALDAYKNESPSRFQLGIAHAHLAVC